MSNETITKQRPETEALTTGASDTGAETKKGLPADEGFRRGLGGSALERTVAPPPDTSVELSPGIDSSLANLIMKETDLATIRRQIQEGINNEGLSQFLNNFYMYLPNDWHERELANYPEMAELGMYEKIYDEDEDEDDLFAFKREERPNATDKALHSERFMQATRGSRLEDIHNAVKSLEGVDGFSGAELEALRLAFATARAARSISMGNEEQAAYLQYALPVYEALRQLGYSHYDLWI